MMGRWGLPPLILLTLLWVSGCATRPPHNIDDGCAIFEQQDGWYEASDRAQRRWGVPIAVQLAIIHQESRFRDDARPPRQQLLGIIPWRRPSSAYGYAQALDSTWDWYREKSGNRWADRDNYADAADFVSWYGHMSQQLLGISKSDAYHQYLAYHEGHGGYRRGSYRDKRWLIAVAQRVAERAKRYQQQLAGCRAALERSVSIWPF